ncbi:MAG: PspC domain-containing protein [Corynebacterium sp.]|uniref:PspC domain-containing protein n=1 Tax=Corynebacterium sp. TaxID=1720 RepID=UPI0026E01043|nr:PspC domain-containing protein [Corynebacterium sp.]MDO5670614.1 PspC domain-containing protein [Corynebacterium sp.]
MNDNAPMHQRRLTRSLTDKYVAGVLGGIAETYGWNSTFVRLIFVAVSLIGSGTPLLAYIIAWFIMPQD